MSRLAECTRVYKRTGRMSHLLAPFDSPNMGDLAEALCGAKPPKGHDWYGTGSQHEHEKAVSLPLCPECARKTS